MILLKKQNIIDNLTGKRKKGCQAVLNIPVPDAFWHRMSEKKWGEASTVLIGCDNSAQVEVFADMIFEGSAEPEQEAA